MTDSVKNEKIWSYLEPQRKEVLGEEVPEMRRPNIVAPTNVNHFQWLVFHCKIQLCNTDLLRRAYTSGQLTFLC